MHIIGGRRTGRSYARAQVCKQFPTAGVVVPDLKHMDKMIALGVQPSQIVVMSEQKPRKSPKTVIDEVYNIDFQP